MSAPSMIFIIKYGFLMRKPIICIRKPKAQISFAVIPKPISAFVFSTRKLQFIFFLNTKHPASSHLLCLYCTVCVEPVGKPHCWFSQDTVHTLVSANWNMCASTFRNVVMFLHQRKWGTFDHFQNSHEP